MILDELLLRDLIRNEADERGVTVPHYDANVLITRIYDRPFTQPAGWSYLDQEAKDFHHLDALSDAINTEIVALFGDF
jgi:hypothetical protein